MIGIAHFDLGAKRDYVFTASESGFKGVHFKETIPFSQTRGITSPKEFPKIDIHPEYYLILPEMFDEQIRGRFDEWVYTLKNGVVKAEFTAAGLQKAAEKLDRLKMSPEERKRYDKIVDNRNYLDRAIVFEREEGLAEGLEKGRAEGREEGKAEGKEEKAVDIARALLAGGMAAGKVADITGLPLEQVKKL
jgi:predicted transposase/invertase (TIGR01784 family)